MALVMRTTMKPTGNGAAPPARAAADTKRPLLRGPAVKRDRHAEPTVSVTLPTAPNMVKYGINDIPLLIHGEMKIGKSSFATQEPNVFVLTFDPPRKTARIIQQYCGTWKVFEQYLVALEAAAKSGNYPYKRVVIDGADIWYRLCQQYCERELSVDYIGDAPYGKGWSMLSGLFNNAVVRMLALPGGCWFISHSAWKEVETRSGQKLNKLLPLLTERATEAIAGQVECNFAYTYNGRDRVLVIRGDERTSAGHNLDGHFRTPTGSPIEEIPMGKTPQEAWRNFLAAFNNQQTVTKLHGELQTIHPKVKRMQMKRK